MNKKIFSGVQPTGNLHLGNYLGAIKNFVELQNDKKNECIYCVVDLHSITVKQDAKILKRNIRETTATFIASGLNPENSIIFNQIISKNLKRFTPQSFFDKLIKKIKYEIYYYSRINLKTILKK